MNSYGRDIQKTISLLNESLELDSNNTEALGHLAGIYLNKNEKIKAREMAIDCLAMDFKNSNCHQVLISSFTRYGEFEESYSYLRDCLAVDPDNISPSAWLPNPLSPLRPEPGR